MVSLLVKREKKGQNLNFLTTLWSTEPHWHVLLSTMLTHSERLILINLDQSVTKQVITASVIVGK